MIDIRLCCAMCGRESKKFTAPDDRLTTLQKIVEDAGWISQQNGVCHDTYCSPTCAR